MSKGNRDSNVVDHNFPQVEKKFWWEGKTWHTMCQYALALLLLGAPLPIAMLLSFWGKSDRAGVMWTISFVLVALLCALEFWKRLDADRTTNQTTDV